MTTTQPKPRQLKTRDFNRTGGALAALGLLLTPLAAHAQVTMSFLPAVQSVSAGSALTFTGSIKNTGTSGVYLTGDTFSFNATGLTLDDTLFFNATATPILLAGGASFPLSGTVGMFTITADSTAVPGSSNVGTFSLTGGATPASGGTLTSQTFTVLVPTPTPEASTLFSLGLPLLGGVCVLAFRRRKPATA